MGSKTNRKSRASKVTEVEHVEEVEKEESTIDVTTDSHTTTKPNRADRKRLKKANKKRKQTPLPPQHLIRGQAIETAAPIRLAPQLVSKLHPDFAEATTPYDRLFETDDEFLFYFSGKHLARVSPFFRDMLGLSLTGSRIREGTRDGGTSLTSLAIPLYFATSSGLALILNVLNFEYNPYPVLPNRVLENDFVDALLNAHECAERFDIPSFAEIVRPFVMARTRHLRLSKPFEAYVLALVEDADRLAKDITWLTLAYPIDSLPPGLLKVLEERYPDSLESLRDLHQRVPQAAEILRSSLEFCPLYDLPEDVRVDLPDCRRYACAITTGYDLDQDEVSTTRRLAAERVMEGIFLDEEVRPGIHTIVSRLNTCVLCNVGLTVLLRSFVIEFEASYKP